MIRLHYYPGNASMAPHILLHELGAPFELTLVDRARDAQRSPEYLRLNPNGTIPVLTDAELVLSETAAILLHLADTHPQAALVPALGTPERAHFYRWMCWLTNTLQATLMIYVYPERWVDEGDLAAARTVQAQAQRNVSAQLDVLEAHMQGSGPHLLGAFGALDPFAFMLCRWTRRFDPALGAPARARPALAAYLERMLQRPSVQRVLSDEQLAPPWV
jgi:glutathione S-transferase